MHITFVIPPPDLTGGQRVVSIYADRLQKRGHDVTVVAISPEPPSVREIARSLVKKRQWLARHQVFCLWLWTYAVLVDLRLALQVALLLR